jgi:hypothetical protein
MSAQRSYSKDRSPKQQAVEISVIEAADRSFLVCLSGRLSPERAEKVLPRNAEFYELGGGRIAAFAHLRAEHVRSLIERLTASPYHVDFSSRLPKAWAAGVGA